MLHLKGEKVYICKEQEYVFAKRFGSANHKSTNLPIRKKIVSANRKYAKCHICGRSANLRKLFEFPTCGFLRFEELICGPPTFGSIAMNKTESLPTLRSKMVKHTRNLSEGLTEYNNRTIFQNVLLIFA